MQKLWFSHGFSMISGVWKASKFAKNLKNGARSVLERPNPGWDGQDRWDWSRKWPMCVQWGPICGKIVAQVESFGGRALAPARENLSEPSPPTRVYSIFNLSFVAPGFLLNALRLVASADLDFPSLAEGCPGAFLDAWRLESLWECSGKVF